jgi:hypothetical protein
MIVFLNSGIYKIYTIRTTVLMCNHATYQDSLWHSGKIICLIKVQIGFCLSLKNSLFVSHIEQMEATILLFPLMISSSEPDIVFLANRDDS